MIAQASTVAESQDLLSDDSFDIVALDLRLGEGVELDVARHITAKGLRARCVVFTLSAPRKQRSQHLKLKLLQPSSRRA